MHPHTRRRTKKRLRRLSQRDNSQDQTKSSNTTPPVPIVSDDERPHLDKALAYFNARRYREEESGDVRAEDVERAEAKIAALSTVKREEPV